MLAAWSWLAPLAVAIGTPGDSVPKSPLPPPQIHAVRLAQPVLIDGVLNETIWATAQRVTTFTQRDPIEGGQPSESTVVYIAYDDAALYVGARMYDAHPDSIVARLGRRDVQLSSDQFTVYVDPYHDRRSGYFFGLNAAGTMYDGTLYNDDWNDNTWDGVWEGKVRIDAQGWTAEFRIPYSQLRFHQQPQYLWGIDFERQIARKNENDYLTFTPKNGSGFVSRFVDLVGIADITPRRDLEIMPYVNSRAEFSRAAVGDPFHGSSQYRAGIGGDLRAGLTPNLTLNATVNPDFGQVEVDPAVVNLSDAETFFQEKRPFFVEGSNVFDQFGYNGATNYWGFNWAGPSFFYSRRIGRSPQGSIDGNALYSDEPTGTHILGALKLTGKVGTSVDVGALSAITSSETAQVDTAGVHFPQQVEPLTYYGVYRAQKQFPDGRQGLGLMATVAARRFDDPALRDQLNSSSFALGTDGWTFLDHDKAWVVTGWAGLSNIHGTATHLVDIQENANHYLQRPDARQLGVDSSATALTGYAGRFTANKQKGNVLFNAAFGFISPTFDVNDLGFMYRTSELNGHVGAGYQWTQPGSVFRSASVLGALFRSYNWDGDIIWSGIFTTAQAQLHNYWSLNTDWAYNPWTVNDRLTRGGPLALNPPGYQADIGINSDSRRAWVLGLQTGTYQSSGGTFWYASPTVTWQPAANVSVSLGPSLTWNHDPAHYIGTFADSLAASTFQHRYVFADLEERDLSAGVRLNWTFTPKLSLQLYVQPLIASAAYGDYKQLAAPRTFNFDVYGREVGAVSRDANGTVHVQASATASDTLSFSDPNFNFRSLRGNAVLRWEFLPGSTMYLVWTQNRNDTETTGDLELGHSFSRLTAGPADNIFMMKITYWWNP
jgi:hypothetical protein